MEYEGIDGAEKLENLKALIEEGLQDLETGNVINGKKAFQEIRKQLEESPN